MGIHFQHFFRSAGENQLHRSFFFCYFFCCPTLSYLFLIPCPNLLLLGILSFRKSVVDLRCLLQITYQLQITIPHQKEDYGERSKNRHPSQTYQKSFPAQYE